MTEPGPPPSPHDLGCFWHGEEPVPDGAYLVCGECWHCFVTDEELLAADRAMRIEVGLLGGPSSADEIRFCPLCSHDF
jgi:hypothetical protein